MKVIAKKLETIEKNLEENGIAIENLASSKTTNFEEVLKTVDDKIDTFENNLLTLKKCIAEKDTFISNLEKKVVDLETKLADISKLHNEKIEELEKRFNVCDAKKDAIDNKVKDIEENQNNLIEESMEKYKCNLCEFTSFYRKGLKIHKKKMHKSYSCKECDKVYDTQRDLKTHIYTGSFAEKSKKKTCNSCDFDCESLETMEVHVKNVIKFMILREI